MAHFAKVRDGVVVDVIVAEPEFFDTFVDSSAGAWIQTSYNTRGGVHYQEDGETPSADQSKALRKNYAGIGFSYDPALDAFIPPKPYPSWTLDENTCWWVAPVVYPEDGNQYNWNEANKTWDLITEE
jgi:hypothetical protein